MATVASEHAQTRKGIDPDTFERILAIGAIVLLAAAAAAVIRGRPDWAAVPTAPNRQAPTAPAIANRVQPRKIMGQTPSRSASPAPLIFA